MGGLEGKDALKRDKRDSLERVCVYMHVCVRQRNRRSARVFEMMPASLPFGVAL